MDTFSPEQRSEIMRRIRSVGNRTTEVRFMRLLRRHHFRGWRRGSKLVGRPDFVFAERRVAIFIDGDFWHGNPRTYRLPKSNCQYWKRKIGSNKARDRRVDLALHGLGWTVIRFWESELDDEAMMVLRLAALKLKGDQRRPLLAPA